MKNFQCIPCGFMYNPELGDPDNGIEPGTPFEEISPEWVCPICHSVHETFKPSTDESSKEKK